MDELEIERFFRFEGAIARTLRRRRLEAGVSQRELAARLSRRGYRLQQTMVGRLESGSRPLRVGELYAIADSLGIAWRDLLPDE